MRIVSLALLLFLVSCKTLAPVSSQSQKEEPRWQRFGATETYQIMKGAATDVMELVTNDSEAGNAFLRIPAGEADPADPVVSYLALRMLETVKKAPGVGIAAPQVGISRRLIWVQRMDKPDKPFEWFVNPRIIRFSEEKELGWEGCLSVPAGFGKCYRSKEITVEHDTTAGKKTEIVSGFTAVIFQHEIDHLDGKLFIDRKEAGGLMPKDQYYEMRRKEKEEKARQEQTDQAK